MKTLNLSILCLLLTFTIHSQTNPLPDCPSSPNCFRTDASKSSKKKQALSYTDAISSPSNWVIEKVSSLEGATFIKEEGNTVHFEFQTKVGKFIDDVTIYIDKKNRKLYFRSASRKGWSDMGANKRRIGKIIQTLLF